MVNRNKRVLEWYTKERGAVAILSGGQTNLPLFTTADVTATSVKGTTVTRTLLYVRMSSASVAQLNVFYWGLVLLNADAAGSGVFPDPADVSDRPGWLARGRLENIQSDLSDKSQWSAVDIDLRSQRILRTEESEYHLIVETAATGFIAVWSAYVRTLMKRP